MKRAILIILILAFFVGGFLGFLYGSVSIKVGRADDYGAVNAGALQNFINQYLKPLLPNFEGDTEEKEFFRSDSSSLISSPPIIPYSPTIDYEQAVIKAVERASPAVVSIIISKNVPIIEQCPYDPFSDLPPEIRQFFGRQFSAPGGPASGWEFYQPCQRGVKKEEVGGGSGFAVSSDGLIVTNKHVVLDEKADYTVFTNDGNKYEAKILARDPFRDLAVLKIPAANLSVLPLGDSDAIKLGQTAIVIGNALGEFRNTVSVGVVSGLSRNITAYGGGTVERIEGLIQTDAAINQGNSGGPLLNLKGEVIGINVAMVSGAQSIGFAIPINQVKRAIESVEKTGEISLPYLGVRYLMVTPELAREENLSYKYGALIRGNQDGPGVLKDSPADKAGLKAEDIILELEEEKITSANPLSIVIQKYNVGDRINIKIIRSGKEIILSATLEKRPTNL